MGDSGRTPLSEGPHARHPDDSLRFLDIIVDARNEIIEKQDSTQGALANMVNEQNKQILNTVTAALDKRYQVALSTEKALANRCLETTTECLREAEALPTVWPGDGSEPTEDQKKFAKKLADELSALNCKMAQERLDAERDRSGVEFKGLAHLARGIAKIVRQNADALEASAEEAKGEEHDEEMLEL